MELESPPWRDTLQSAFSKRASLLAEGVEGALNTLLVRAGFLTDGFIRTKVIKFSQLGDVGVGVLLDVQFATSPSSASSPGPLLALIPPLLAANTTLGPDIRVKTDCGPDNCPDRLPNSCDTAQLSEVLPTLPAWCA